MSCTKSFIRDLYKVINLQKIVPDKCLSKMNFAFYLATMRVYHDFFHYQGGIYKHSKLSESDRTGYHSVRIVGWGEEMTYLGVQKYWVS